MRDEPGLAAGVARLDDGSTDIRMIKQNMLDLLQLDPIAADLDLIVDAPHAFDRAVGAAPGEIAGPIQTRVGILRKGVA